MLGLPGKLAGAVRGGKVRRDGIRSTTGFAYLCDNTVGFARPAAVMHENLGAGLGEGECVLPASMPREAPVTRAVLPVRLAMICPALRECLVGHGVIR